MSTAHLILQTYGHINGRNHPVVVRHKHAERIRAWIMGQAKEHLGVANEAMAEVSKLLEPLGPQFRRDLGFVCESHHLNDLGDLNTYKPSQPYGNSDAARVAIQYADAPV